MDLVEGRRPAPLPTTALDRRWSGPSVDFGAVADGLSLLMPHLEPVAIAAVRDGVGELTETPSDRELERTARVWIRQEAAHQGEHRRYNEALLESSSGMRGVDRAARWLADFIGRRGVRSRLAFTCGFEAVAYSVARWVEPRMGELFRGADSGTASLFLWHLAEEVEHKSLAHDLDAALGHHGIARFLGGMAALAAIGPLTLVAALVGLARHRRLRHPSTWWHLVVWSISFAFSALTAVVLLAVPGHSPADLADPIWYRQYLRGADPDSGRIEPWQPPHGRRFASAPRQQRVERTTHLIGCPHGGCERPG